MNQAENILTSFFKKKPMQRHPKCHLLFIKSPWKDQKDQVTSHCHFLIMLGVTWWF